MQPRRFRHPPNVLLLLIILLLIVQHEIRGAAGPGSSRNDPRRGLCSGRRSVWKQVSDAQPPDFQTPPKALTSAYRQRGSRLSPLPGYSRPGSYRSDPLLNIIHSSIISSRFRPACTAAPEMGEFAVLRYASCSSRPEKQIWQAVLGRTKLQEARQVPN